MSASISPGRSSALPATSASSSPQECVRSTARQRSVRLGHGSFTDDNDDVVPVHVRVPHQDVWLKTMLRRSWSASEAKQHIFHSAGLLPLPSVAAETVYEFASRPRTADAAAGDNVFAHLAHHPPSRTQQQQQQWASKSSPSTPAAEDVLGSPFVDLGGGDVSRLEGSPHYSLKSASSHLDLRFPSAHGSPSGPSDTSYLRVVSHGSPLASRRLPPGVPAPTLKSLALPTLKAADSPASPPAHQSAHTPRPRTASSVETSADRPFSVLTTSSYTDSLPDSIPSTSSTSEMADELRPLPDARSTASPRHLVGSSGDGLRRRNSASSLTDSSTAVPNINLHGPDALGRSWTGGVTAPNETEAHFDNFDLIDAASGALLLFSDRLRPCQLIEVHPSDAHLILPRSDLEAYCQPTFQSQLWVSHVAPQSRKQRYDGGTDRLGWAKEWIRIQAGELVSWRSSEAFFMGAFPKSRHPLQTLISVREWDAPLIKSIRSMPPKSIQLGFAVQSADATSRPKTAWVWLRAPTESLHTSILRVLSLAAPSPLARSAPHQPPAFDRMDVCHLARITMSFPASLLLRDKRFQHLLQTWLDRRATSAVVEHPHWSFIPLNASSGWIDLQEEASFRGVEPTAGLEKVVISNQGRHARRGINILPPLHGHGRPSHGRLQKDETARMSATSSPPPLPRSPNLKTRASHRPATHDGPGSQAASLPGFGHIRTSSQGHSALRSARSLTHSDRTDLPAASHLSETASDGPPLSSPSTTTTAPPSLFLPVRHSLPASPRSVESAMSPTSITSMPPSSLGDVEGHEWVYPFGSPTSDRGSHSEGRHGGKGRSPAPSIHRRLTDEYPPSPGSIGFPTCRSTLNSPESHHPSAGGPMLSPTSASSSTSESRTSVTSCPSNEVVNAIEP